jgi:nitrile hydratase
MHDLGGRQGFGRVRYTLDAKPFHAAWEVRANSLYALAVRLGIFNMDEYRHAIERGTRHYLSASYYERSLTGTLTLCVEKGVMTRDELERRAGGRVPLAAASAPGRPNIATRERFKGGDRVRVRDDYVPGHVRMPGYIRGRTGTVVGESPAYLFPTRTPTRLNPRTNRRTMRFRRGSLAEFLRLGAGSRRRISELPGARVVA